MKPQKPPTPNKQLIPGNVNIENARIAFRNFVGKAGKFNAAGRRNFCIILDNSIGEDLSRMGWNIKYLNPREEGDEPQAYIQVTVSYEKKPPKIVIITESKNKKTFLDEETVPMLDWADIKNVDVTITPYVWEVNGKTGVKAYLKTMYVTLVEDEFEHKYQDVPDSAISNLVPDRDD
jgi:hypothetical protein